MEEDVSRLPTKVGIKFFPQSPQDHYRVNNVYRYKVFGHFGGSPISCVSEEIISAAAEEVFGGDFIGLGERVSENDNHTNDWYPLFLKRGVSRRKKEEFTKRASL